MIDPAPNGGDPSARYRLPYTVEPRRYELHLAPDLDAATFTGTVRIDAHAHQPVTRIVLHAAELAIDRVRVTAGDSTQEATATVVTDEEQLLVDLDRPAAAGPLSIEIGFSGVLGDKLCGFYRSTFSGDDGASRTIATTQFEATDARRAFPCFDEPDRKAVFSISLDVPAGLSGFSNGPVVAEDPLPGGGVRVRFGDTIPMSTYLVAFVVGPLVASAPLDVDGIPVRVVHVPGREDLTAFALEAAAHALRFFTEWFALPYPADKLDLVAIPDFAFGAMENLGCVTFRETALLVDPARASRLELERVADVISHEIAHMWFGDLVTMRWWNGIWLNEAFATLMELLCVDHFRPEWQRWVSFSMERDVAMATDALHSTRPVEYPVGPPEEAQGMFDVLTYQKGASVLRMLERYLGESRFREGIRRYLATHRLGNTETSDLWDAIEQASGEPVRDIMDSWILQGGFPVVIVERVDGGVSLRQEPFAYAPATGPSAIGSNWRIPVLARPATAGAAAGDNDKRALLGEQPVEIDIADGATVLVNAGGSGYYRVQYQVGELHALAGALDGLDALERFNLLGDTWAAVVAGGAGLGDFLLLAESTRHDADPDVWAQATGALAFLDHVVDDGNRPLLAAYTRALAGPAFDALGWEPRPSDGERTATLRAQLLGTLGTVGQDGDIQRSCFDRHATALDGGRALDPDLAPAVVSVVAAAGGVAEFEAFLQRHRNPQTPQEEIRYLYALTGFEDPELAERAFDMAVNEVRTQNGPFMVQMLLASRVSGPATWERLSQRWDDLQERFPTNIFPRMLDSVKLLCRDEALGVAIRDFLLDHPLPSGQRTVEQIVERLGVNMVLAARLRDKVAGELSSGLGRLAPG
ncbi:MAG: M1 family metallopeptidase [Acidimicrobiales bacterium]